MLRSMLLSVALAGSAIAAGSSSFNVTTTATVVGNTIQGVVSITNIDTKAMSVSSVTDFLEVRFQDGYPVPAGLPVGSTAGYYRVTSITLPSPGTVAPAATATVPYSFDTCASSFPRYAGVKDMRNVATVVAGGRSRQGRSANFVPPSTTTCPVCGNGRREATEQCDGGACCTATCTFAGSGTTCNDGNACTRTDQCQSGVCIGGNPVVCSASDQCHVAGTCNTSTGVCSNPNATNGTSCNDSNACSTSDACSNGVCRGAAIVCNDGNACTSDACSGGACVFTNNTNPCEDGSVCTVGDACQDGACQSGAPRECNDHKTCTNDACDEAVACDYTPTEVCDGCDAAECTICRDECTGARAMCESGCWEGFWGCVGGCTSTYCAPFCQVDLGYCIAACPDVTVCGQGCDAGNGCAAGCVAP